MPMMVTLTGYYGMQSYLTPWKTQVNLLTETAFVGVCGFAGILMHPYFESFICNLVANTSPSVLEGSIISCLFSRK